MMHRLVRVHTVEPLDGYRVRLGFEDGTRREVDLEIYLRSPIFEPIRSDPAVFRSVKVERSTIAWPNGADIDPDVLYYRLNPAWIDVEKPAAGSERASLKQTRAAVHIREDDIRYDRFEETDSNPEKTQ